MTDTLDDLLSADPHRIGQASWEIITTRDIVLLEDLRAALPTIRRATADVELGGMIRPNRDALDHALRKVRDYRSWRCWCDDYPRLLAFSPDREEERGDRGQDAHGKTRACSEVHVRLPLIDPCASARDMCTCVHSPS